MSDNFQEEIDQTIPPLNLSQLGVQQPQTTGASVASTTTTPVSSTKMGRKSIPESLLHERRDYAVGLKLAGMSNPTILRQINFLDKTKGWGSITRFTLDKELAEYYRKNRVTGLQEQDHLINLRSAYIDQFEKTVEKLSFHVADKQKVWKPFEYITALTELAKLQLSYLEVQNWNLGRPALVTVQNNYTTNIFEQAAIDMHFTPQPVIDDLNNMFREAVEKMEGDKDIIVVESINDV